MNCEINIAGFGGQGVLFLGKLIAFAGMYAGYEVSWMPSYGMEMRGGTANCTVIISDEPIGSPESVEPHVLIAMNKPSFTKFEPTVRSGGTIFVDSSLAKVSSDRIDVEVLHIPATEIAMENGVNKAANLVLAGRFFKKMDFITEEAVEKALRRCVPGGREDVFEANKRAIAL